MGFIIKIGSGFYVKRTAHFRAFGGKVYVTTDRNDARVWTRKSDARSAAKIVLHHRSRGYGYEKNPLPPGQVTYEPREILNASHSQDQGSS